MSEMVVERILKKQLRNGEPYYFLKWEGLNNRHNSWEPIENLTGCAELLAEFETSRAIKVLGLARRNDGDIMYVIQMYDALAPEIVNNRQVRILWSKLVFRFLLSKIKFVGFETCGSVPTTFLSTIPTTSRDRDVDPQIVYVTDTMGGIQFCLKFSDGNVFVPAEEVAEKWMDKALDYLEEHLVIE